MACQADVSTNTTAPLNIGLLPGTRRFNLKTTSRNYYRTQELSDKGLVMWNN